MSSVNNQRRRSSRTSSRQSRSSRQNSIEASRRANLYRIITHNEEHLISLVAPTAVQRLILERRGVRIYTPYHVIQADIRATNVLTEHLTSLELLRTTNEMNQFTMRELRVYNQRVIRTINMFLMYREFQLWQGSHLPNDEYVA